MNKSDREKLKKYRSIQRAEVIERDGGLCQWCLHMKNKRHQGYEVHHVYGRGNWNTRLKYEHKDKLVSLCLMCHYNYHHVQSPRMYKETMIWVLKKAVEDGREERKVVKRLRHVPNLWDHITTSQNEGDV